MTRAKTSDQAIAYKVIGLSNKLSKYQKSVAAALVSHFNRRTGQCDPSVSRLSELLGGTERTVGRATEKLAAEGLFKKDIHGGYSYRNSYRPIWSRFHELNDQWDASCRRNSTASSRTEESALHGQKCQTHPDKNVNQTHINNPEKETQKTTAIVTGASSGEKNFFKEQGKGREITEPRCPTNVSNGSARSKAITAQRYAAERRWSIALRLAFEGNPVGYAAAIDRIDDDLAERATDAECQRRNSGITFVLERLAELQLRPNTSPSRA